MTATCCRLLAGAFFFLFLNHAARADADAARYAGRPVIEVLLELREPGLDFIYSSELVPTTMRVTEEPRASGGLPIAREILAAHGLTLSVVRPGLYAVVPTDRPAAREAGNDADDARDARAALQVQLSEVVVSTSRYAFERYRAMAP